jgi:glutamine cyclotransferase
MKKFLICLSSFLILFGGASAFAAIYSEDFNDNYLDPPREANSEFEINDLENYADNLVVYFSTQYDPTPDIKVNGSDSWISVTPNDTVNISASLSPNDKLGAVCDWWVYAMTHFGTYWLNPSLQWVKSTTPVSVGQFALYELADTPILSRQLPLGIYTYSFVIDDNPDGVFDITWQDYVNVICKSERIELSFEYRYPISQRIGGIGLSPDDDILFVAYWTDTLSDKVEWYSTDTPYNLLDYIAYGRCHEDVVVSSNNRYFFTTTYYSNNVSRFDLLDNNTQITLPTSSWPETITLTPDRSKMVVFGGMDGRNYDMNNDALHIFNISGDSFYEICTIPQSDFLDSYLVGKKMAFTENGDFGYFLTGREKWDNGPAKLNEVSMNSCTITDYTELPTLKSYGIALFDNRIYVSDYDNSKILVYDRQNLSKIDEWPVSNRPRMLAIPPNKSGLFVLFPGAPGGGSLEVLNLSNGIKIGGYPELSCNSAKDIEFNSDGSKAYIGCSADGVLVLNVNSN